MLKFSWLGHQSRFDVPLPTVPPDFPVTGHLLLSLIFVLLHRVAGIQRSLRQPAAPGLGDVMSVCLNLCCSMHQCVIKYQKIDRLSLSTPFKSAKPLQINYRFRMHSYIYFNLLSEASCSGMAEKLSTLLYLQNSMSRASRLQL